MIAVMIIKSTIVMNGKGSCKQCKEKEVSDPAPLGNRRDIFQLGTRVKVIQLFVHSLGTSGQMSGTVVTL